jgi:hypothetical protein
MQSELLQTTEYKLCTHPTNIKKPNEDQGINIDKMAQDWMEGHMAILCSREAILQVSD